MQRSEESEEGKIKPFRSGLHPDGERVATGIKDQEQSFDL